ncbi:MAG TPA: hypothetical protein VLH40_06100 [Atribacteraceae bacterium]|nr:hypothetical protein [Atribacteraceae bacterium]
MMKRAVLFGAGNIGRGFIGHLLWESGYETVYVEAYEPLVEKLRKRGSYPLRLLEKTGTEVNLEVDRFQAVWSKDSKAVSDAIVHADIAFTAVGARNLPEVAGLFARGITRRARENPDNLNVLLCENLKEAPGFFRDELMKHLGESERDYVERKVGLVGTVVARMVPVMDARFGVDDPLFIVAESYHRLPCDRLAIKGELGRISGVVPVNNFPAEENKKLYIHNLGHATLAYLGYRIGIAYIHEAIGNDLIRNRLGRVYDETAYAINRKYPDLSPAETEAFAADLKERFANPLMMDTITRVARDPIRKLAPGDRLMGGIDLCLSQGIFPENITNVCAQALGYDYPDDPEASRLQKILQEAGIATVLKEICGLDPDSPVGKRIVEHYNAAVRN